MSVDEYSDRPRDATAEFTGSGFGLLGWEILYALASAVIIPTSWAACAFLCWLFSKLRLSDGTTFRFVGRPGEAWGWFVLAAMVGFAPQVARVDFRTWDPHDQHALRHGLDINLLSPLIIWDRVAVRHYGRYGVSLRVNLAAPLTALLSAAVAVFIIRWVVRNTQTTRRKPLDWAGTWPAYLGYLLLFDVSFISIVGWAWVAAAMLRWFCRNLDAGDDCFVFTGTGPQILWRGVVGTLACCLILPIPWILAWWYRWLFSCTLVRGAPA